MSPALLLIGALALQAPPAEPDREADMFGDAATTTDAQCSTSALA
jgi:hypothetical protein